MVNYVDAYNWVAQFSSINYNDPGATATDAVSGALTPTVTGTVNMNVAGDYTITYAATDVAGNTATAVRTVTIDGARHIAGSYTVEDFTGTVSNGMYPETLSASVTDKNHLQFTKFAFYVNGNVYGTIEGTSITIPKQTVNCGNPAANRTFAGSGTYTNGFTSFTINFTETTNGNTVTCHDVYSRN